MTNRWGAGASILYSFSYDAFGVLSYVPVGTISNRVSTNINDQGVFGYTISFPLAKAVKLYRPGQTSLTLYQSKTSFDVGLGYKPNNANDLVYVVNSVPYLYRYSENKSHKLYDLADSYTKSVIFASSAGDLQNSAILTAVVGDDNVAGTGDKFDTISGSVPDPVTGKAAAFVLIPQ